MDLVAASTPAIDPSPQRLRGGLVACLTALLLAASAPALGAEVPGAVADADPARQRFYELSGTLVISLEVPPRICQPLERCRARRAAGRLQTAPIRPRGFLRRLLATAREPVFRR